MVTEKKMNLIEILEQEEMARMTANKTIPEFRAGDTVVVNVNVVEGSRKRVQAFEGVVIARRNRGLLVHRSQDFEWRRRGTYVPALFPDDRFDRSEASR